MISSPSGSASLSQNRFVLPLLSYLQGATDCWTLFLTSLGQPWSFFGVFLLPVFHASVGGFWPFRPWHFAHEWATFSLFLFSLEICAWYLLPFPLVLFSHILGLLFFIYLDILTCLVSIIWSEIPNIFPNRWGFFEYKVRSSLEFSLFCRDLQNSYLLSVNAATTNAWP